jgi:hypothetical protein
VTAPGRLLYISQRRDPVRTDAEPIVGYLQGRATVPTTWTWADDGDRLPHVTPPLTG